MRCKNSAWQVRVRNLLSSGLGVEDIAIELNCAVEDVRREVSILRAEGCLADIFRREHART